jgi:hypothetical protein
MKGFLCKNIAFSAVFSGFLMLSGCMMGPDYSRPQTAADPPAGYYRSGRHSQDANDLAEIDGWWKSFGDPVTADLVREALANNYDLKAVAARVLQAEALFTETLHIHRIFPSRTSLTFSASSNALKGRRGKTF